MTDRIASRSASRPRSAVPLALALALALAPACASPPGPLDDQEGVAAPTAEEVGGQPQPLLATEDDGAPRAPAADPAVATPDPAVDLAMPALPTPGLDPADPGLLAVLPDLVPARVTMARNAAGTYLNASIVIANRGQAWVSGPFNVSFGVTTTGAYREVTLTVPSWVWLPPGGEYVAGSINNIRIIRDSRGTATFVFDALVDSNLQIAEASDTNNYLHQTIRDHRR